MHPLINTRLSCVLPCQKRPFECLNLEFWCLEVPKLPLIKSAFGVDFELVMCPKVILIVDLGIVCLWRAMWICVAHS